MNHGNDLSDVVVSAARAEERNSTGAAARLIHHSP